MIQREAVTVPRLQSAVVGNTVAFEIADALPLQSLGGEIALQELLPAEQIGDGLHSLDPVSLTCELPEL